MTTFNFTPLSFYFFINISSMGRPIKQTKMTTNYPGASLRSGTIAVTGYRASGGALVSSTTAYIVSQRGSKLFNIHLEDSSEAVYELKAVAPASLANTSNQFCVQIILDDSTVAYVDKFHNRTIHYVTEAGNSGTCTYTLGAEGTDEQRNATDSNIGSIDVI